MFFALSKTLDVLLSPVGWVLLLLALAAFRERARRGATLAALVTLYAFSTDAMANRLEWYLESGAERTVRADTTYDTVVLLGGAVAHGPAPPSGLPSFNDNVERLLVTFDLLRTGRARTAILSGGQAAPDDPASEASVLAAQLVSWGIAPDRLAVEDAARNTRENATNAARIVREHGYGSVLVVTSAFHVWRSARAFRAVGLPVDFLPVDYRATDPARSRLGLLPRAHNLSQSEHCLRELAGRLVYRAVGYAGR